MAEFIPVPPFDLVVFGATGDLALRKLFPALAHRFLDGQIPPNSRLIGTARHAMDAAGFRAQVLDALREHTDSADDPRIQDFLGLIQYAPLDVSHPASAWECLENVLDDGDGKTRIFYLAVAPSLFTLIAQRLGEAGLATPSSRIVLEKPIGRDLASAKAINDGVGAVFDEHRIFRIDHYLGKETVQNLMVLRFGNTLFEPLWSRAAIDHVQITVAETLGVEGRGEYYDRSGALRDMVQNHILQLLCLIAMEPPHSMEADAIRAEKLKVLSALKPIGAEHAAKTVRGQYREGLVDGAPAPAYAEEAGVKTTRTETFVAIKAEIENWRWAGVPFYLRTGKRMAERRSEIIVQFKPTPVPLFGGAGSNRLVLRLQPDEAVDLWLNIKEPGPGGLRVRTAPLNLSYAEFFTLRYPDAYERLLMDVARGNLSLFMRRDEVEAAWRWSGVFC